jgi:hypothetical protein
MTPILTDSSAVVVANDVNLSIFKPLWLTRNEVIREDEIGPNLIVTPALVQVPSENFELDIFPNRIQLRVRPRHPHASEYLRRILGGVVELLPHTPYRAVGLNFDYLVAVSETGTFAEWNRREFAAPFPLRVAIGADNTAEYGAYFSYDVFDMRLKVDAKPITVNETKTIEGVAIEAGQELMRLNFNFHSDIPQESEPRLIVERLEIWNQAVEHADAVVGNLERQHAGATGRT